jgi:hypothetical protein
MRLSRAIAIESSRAADALSFFAFPPTLKVIDVWANSATASNAIMA